MKTKYVRGSLKEAWSLNRSRDIFIYGEFAVETDSKHTKSFKKYIISM